MPGNVNKVRTLVNYTVGFLILMAGLFLIFNESLKLSEVIYPPSKGDKIFGILCVSYGFWRIYRGYKKNNLA